MAIYRMAVDITWDGPGSPGCNVWHFRTDSPELALGTPDDAADAIRDFYVACNGGATPSASVFAQGVRINCTEAVEVSTQEIVPVDWTEIVSGSASAEAPQLLSVVASWRTSIAARRGMGRTFVGPLHLATVENDGSVGNGAVTMIKNAGDALIAASSAVNDWAVGVYGLQNPTPEGYTGKVSELPHVLRDFTAVRVRDRFSVLRSRRD